MEVFKAMPNIYTLRITYADCDGRIWREAQISEYSYLCDLGYMILASFDTLAYHLFNISFGTTVFSLPTEEEELEPERDLFCVMLKELELKIGDKLEMVYDFGCDQVFNIEVINISEMPRCSGRAYPKIIAGEGKGILDDTPAYETLELIEKIDKTGRSDVTYLCQDERERIWDYRDYDIVSDNALLKGQIAQIADGYSYFEAFI